MESLSHVGHVITIEKNHASDEESMEFCSNIPAGDVVFDDSLYDCSQYGHLEEVVTSNSGSLIAMEGCVSPTANHCPYCTKYFATAEVLQSHVSSVHKVKFVELTKPSCQIKCAFSADCEATFCRLNFYRQHLIVMHGVKLEKITLNFQTYKEFWLWKVQEQQKTLSHFNKFFHKHVNDERKVSVIKKCFICCRSGKNSAKCSKRKYKKQMKMDSCCPAMMEVLCYPEKFVLTYYKTHVGHGNSNETLKTSLKMRMQNTIQRQQKLYEQLKIEVKETVDEFIDSVHQNKFTYDFLKMLSKNLKEIFDPVSWKSGIFVQGTTKSISLEHSSSVLEGKLTENSSGGKNKTTSTYSDSNDKQCINEFDAGSVSDHVYVNSSAGYTSRKEQAAGKGPIVIYASRQFTPKPHSSAGEEVDEKISLFQEKGNQAKEIGSISSTVPVVGKGVLQGNTSFQKQLSPNATDSLLNNCKHVVMDENSVCRVIQGAEECKVGSSVTFIPIMKAPVKLSPSQYEKEDEKSYFDTLIPLPANSSYKSIILTSKHFPSYDHSEDILSETNYLDDSYQSVGMKNSATSAEDENMFTFEKDSQLLISTACSKDSIQKFSKLEFSEFCDRESEALKSSLPPAVHDCKPLLLKPSLKVEENSDAEAPEVDQSEPSSRSDKFVSLLQTPTMVVKSLCAVKKRDEIIDVKHDCTLSLDGLGFPAIKPLINTSLTNSLKSQQKYASDSKKVYLDSLWNLYKNS